MNTANNQNFILQIIKILFKITTCHEAQKHDKTSTVDFEDF